MATAVFPNITAPLFARHVTHLSSTHRLSSPHILKYSHSHNLLFRIERTERTQPKTNQVGPSAFISHICAKFHTASNIVLAGHSHWANIQHQKGRKDRSRSQRFAKVSKEITTAVRVKKNGNPAENPQLSLALQHARAANFPKDRIEQAIAKGLGKQVGILEYGTYELYGPNRIAFIVSTASDNKNRIVAKLRAWAMKYQGNLVPTGTFDFLFKKIGKVELAIRDDRTEEQLMEILLHTSAQDVEIEGQNAMVSCEPIEEMVLILQEKISEAGGFEIKSGEVCNMPTKMVELVEEEIDIFYTAVDQLIEIDGVESYSHNALINEENSVAPN